MCKFSSKLLSLKIKEGGVINDKNKRMQKVFLFLTVAFCLQCNLFEFGNHGLDAQTKLKKSKMCGHLLKKSRGVLPPRPRLFLME